MKSASALTDQGLNILIAKACGWTKIELDVATLRGMALDQWIGTSPQGTNKIGLPNYHTDLNAMHKAENTLRRAERLEYADTLAGITGHQFDEPHLLLSATARHRAEAFVSTLDLTSA